MRTVKTGIGVTASMLLEGLVVKNSLYTAIACIMSMQESVTNSVESGLSRIKGTILGGIIGFVFASIIQSNPFVCGIGIIATIHICNSLNLNDEISVATVTFLAIYSGTVETSLLALSVSRVIDTSVGVAIGVWINYAVARPNHVNNIYNDFNKVKKYTEKYLDYKIFGKNKYFDVDELEDVIKELNNTYSTLVNEFDYNSEENKNEDMKVKKMAMLSREIHFHIQSVELMKKKLYLSEYNYKNLSSLYPDKTIKMEVDDEDSPVFNHHLNRIIKQYDRLKKGTEDID